jgi:hypothetical protein
MPTLGHLPSVMTPLILLLTTDATAILTFLANCPLTMITTLLVEVRFGITVLGQL